MKQFAILLLVFGLIACGGKSASSSTPASTASTITHATASPSHPKPRAQVGDTITTTVGDEFTVYQITPFQSTNQFTQPKPGFAFFAVDVKEKAGPQGLDANPFDFALVMDDDTRLQAEPGWKEPALHATQLGEGQAVRGWITYQVPSSGKIAQVVYTNSTNIAWQVS